METDYLAEMNNAFGVSKDDQTITEDIIHRASKERETILQDLRPLIDKYGLAYGLLALYRQQVHNGFVLTDPLNTEGIEITEMADPNTGIMFRVMWTPDRELRRDHHLLIRRGVIAEQVDESRLINRDSSGKPCYLCKENITVQNPAEVLLPLWLGMGRYFAGANFAPITNNHYTIMSLEHRTQRYSKTVLAALIDFVEQTEGHFRAAFNGRAGPSIPWHEHLQATTEAFPIEDIGIDDEEIVHLDGDRRVSRPFYYVPLWVVEGTDADDTREAAHQVVKAWQTLDERHHTTNLIATKRDDRLRVFVFLKDTRKQVADGKIGGVASFECGGIIVLSFEAGPDQPEQTNERDTFESASLRSVQEMLTAIAPEQVLLQVDFR